MLADQNEVLNYIPQRQPMVMVDGLLELDDNGAVSQLQLNPHNILCRGGFFTEAGLMENMAQSAALFSGYHTIRSGEEVKIGFIGAIKRMSILELPKDSDCINTTVRKTHEYDNVVIIEAEVTVEMRKVAAAELSIFTRD
jgi:3-hydroxyacyl-[acyl-carrier-protein] dehydratase